MNISSFRLEYDPHNILRAVIRPNHVRGGLGTGPDFGCYSRTVRSMVEWLELHCPESTATQTLVFWIIEFGTASAALAFKMRWYEGDHECSSVSD